MLAIMAFEKKRSGHPCTVTFDLSSYASIGNCMVRVDQATHGQKWRRSRRLPLPSAIFQSLHAP